MNDIIDQFLFEEEEDDEITQEEIDNYKPGRGRRRTKELENMSLRDIGRQERIKKIKNKLSARKVRKNKKKYIESLEKQICLLKQICKEQEKLLKIKSK